MIQINFEAGTNIKAKETGEKGIKSQKNIFDAIFKLAEKKEKIADTNGDLNKTMDLLHLLKKENSKNDNLVEKIDLLLEKVKKIENKSQDLNNFSEEKKEIINEIKDLFKEVKTEEVIEDNLLNRFQNKETNFSIIVKENKFNKNEINKSEKQIKENEDTDLKTIEVSEFIEGIKNIKDIVVQKDVTKEIKTVQVTNNLLNHNSNEKNSKDYLMMNGQKINKEIHVNIKENSLTTEQKVSKEIIKNDQLNRNETVNFKDLKKEIELIFSNAKEIKRNGNTTVEERLIFMTNKSEKTTIDKTNFIEKNIEMIKNNEIKVNENKEKFNLELKLNPTDVIKDKGKIEVENDTKIHQSINIEPTNNQTVKTITKEIEIGEFHKQIKSQVSEMFKIRYINPNKTTMFFHSEDMGNVKIEFERTNEIVTIKFKLEDLKHKQEIENSLEEIKDELKDKGIDIEYEVEKEQEKENREEKRKEVEEQLKKKDKEEVNENKFLELFDEIMGG